MHHRHRFRLCRRRHHHCYRPHILDRNIFSLNPNTKSALRMKGVLHNTRTGCHVNPFSNHGVEIILLHIHQCSKLMEVFVMLGTGFSSFE